MLPSTHSARHVPTLTSLDSTSVSSINKLYPLLLILGTHLLAVSGVAQTLPSVDPQPVFTTHPLVHQAGDNGEASVDLSSAGVQGRALYSFTGKHISIEWRYDVPGFTEGAHPLLPSRHSTVQYYRTSFRPTEVACIAENKILVAGVNNAGVNLVEEWTFGSVVVPSVTYTAGGQQVPPELIVAPVERRLVFNTPYGGGTYVGVIFRNWADENRPFLVLTGFGLMIQLDLTTLAHTDVATVDGSVGIAIPALLDIDSGNPFTMVGSGELLNGGGAAYWFGSSNNGGPPSLVLYDMDFDGAIDLFESLDYSGWSSSPLASVSNFAKLR